MPRCRLLRFDRQPHRIPPIAAATSPSLYGQPAARTATTPAESAAAMLGRSVSVGTTSAMKVSATVKSSAQPGGICVPRAIPTAVLACQALHCASPAPRKYYWRNGEREGEAVS